MCAFHLSLNLYLSFFFFFNDTATTEIYTLSLHDALPILGRSETLKPETRTSPLVGRSSANTSFNTVDLPAPEWPVRSEEHTSELQSLAYLVCRLLLEKKKKTSIHPITRPRWPCRPQVGAR